MVFCWETGPGDRQDRPQYREHQLEGGSRPQRIEEGRQVPEKESEDEVHCDRSCDSCHSPFHTDHYQDLKQLTSIFIIKHY